MCWSPEVSLGTYLFSAIPLFILTFHYKYISIPMFLAAHSFISMQLVEFFLWIYLNNPALNYFFSVIGFILVISQPFFYIVSIEIFQYKYLVLLIYFLCILYFYIVKNIEFKTVVAKNGHLEWKWLNVPLYSALVWLGFFCIRPLYLYLKNPAKNKTELLWFFIIITTFGISYATYVDAKTWGSMWCYIANFIAFRYYWIIFSKL